MYTIVVCSSYPLKMTCCLLQLNIHLKSCLHTSTHCTECRGFESHLRQLIFFLKSNCRGQLTFSCFIGVFLEVDWHFSDAHCSRTQFHPPPANCWKSGPQFHSPQHIAEKSGTQFHTPQQIAEKSGPQFHSPQHIAEKSGTQFHTPQ